MRKDNPNPDPSPLSPPSLVATQSRLSLSSLLATYQKHHNVFTRKYNNNNDDNASDSKSQLQKIDPRLIIDNTKSTPFENFKNLLREWQQSPTTCDTTKRNHAI